MEACGITPGARLTIRKLDSPRSYSVSVGHSSEPIDLSPEVAQDVRILRTLK
jgi:hypothetical protein